MTFRDITENKYTEIIKKKLTYYNLKYQKLFLPKKKMVKFYFERNPTKYEQHNKEIIIIHSAKPRWSLGLQAGC